MSAEATESRYVAVQFWHLGEWAREAECGRANPLLFDAPGPDDDGQVVSARLYEAASLCAACPVQDACAETAIRNNLVGVWGGLLFLGGSWRTDLIAHIDDYWFWDSIAAAHEKRQRQRRNAERKREGTA